MSSEQGWLLLALILASCRTTDGAPLVGEDTSGASCSGDRDCGRGRHCVEGLCAVLCTRRADCARGEAADCSPCGRCLPPGASPDLGCLSPGERPCRADADCGEEGCASTGYCAPRCSLTRDCAGAGRFLDCVDGQFCVRTCSRDDDCADLGFHQRCASGLCAPDPARVPFPVPPEGAPPSWSWQGTYGALAVSAVRTQPVPLISRLDTQSPQWLLVRATASGADLELAAKFCEVEFRNFSDDDPPLTAPFRTEVPDAVLRVLPVLRFRVPSPPPLSAGARTTTDFFLEVRGAQLARPFDDPLPTRSDPSTAWDQDRDGQPGVTYRLVGSLAGELYQTSRWAVRFELVALDERRIGGNATENYNDSRVLGASQPLLINDGVSSTHPDPQRTYLRLLRLRDDASCAEVRAAAHDDFLTFAPRWSP